MSFKKQVETDIDKYSKSYCLTLSLSAKEQIKVNINKFSKSYCLILYSYCGLISYIKFLIENYVYHDNTYFEIAFMVAVKEGHKKVAKYLIKVRGSDIICCRIKDYICPIPYFDDLKLHIKKKSTRNYIRPTFDQYFKENISDYSRFYNIFKLCKASCHHCFDQDDQYISLNKILNHVNNSNSDALCSLLIKYTKMDILRNVELILIELVNNNDLKCYTTDSELLYVASTIAFENKNYAIYYRICYTLRLLDINYSQYDLHISPKYGDLYSNKDFKVFKARKYTFYNKIINKHNEREIKQEFNSILIDNFLKTDYFKINKIISLLSYFKDAGIIIKMTKISSHHLPFWKNGTQIAEHIISHVIFENETPIDFLKRVCDTDYVMDCLLFVQFFNNCIYRNTGQFFYTSDTNSFLCNLENCCYLGLCHWSILMLSQLIGTPYKGVWLMKVTDDMYLGLDDIPTVASLNEWKYIMTNGLKNYDQDMKNQNLDPNDTDPNI